MTAKEQKPARVARRNVSGDLSFSSKDAAALRRLKSTLQIEIIKTIEKRKLKPSRLEKRLNVPQPQVSELLSGKISRMTATG